MEALILVLAMIVLLLLQGFFSGAEIALVHCDKARLRHRSRQGHGSSSLALRLLERPEVLLSTTLIGTNVALVVLTVLGTDAMVRFFGEVGDLYAVIVFTPLILVLAEVVPKSIFQQQADELTPKIIYPLYFFSVLLYPAVFIFSRTARLAARLIGGRQPGTAMFAIREQLRAVLETAEGAVAIDVFDRARIRNVIRFGELSVGNIMIPAAEMPAVDLGQGMADAIDLVRTTGAKQVPVFERARSNVVGMISLTAWDIMEPETAERMPREVMKPAYYVSSQQSLAELLPVLRRRHDQAAVVVDEYGSAIGMITVAIILETVVGRLGVEGNPDQKSAMPASGYVVLGEDAYIVDARLPISDINEILATNMTARDAHTIGGLVETRLRHVPHEGEQVVEEGYTFTVVEATERAVTKLRVERTTGE